MDIRSIALAFCLFGAAHAFASTQIDPAASVTVLETSAELGEDIDQLVSVFKAQGTGAMAKQMNYLLDNPDKLGAWREFAKQGQMKVVDINIHPNEQKAVDWMNARFERMGLPNLQLNGVHDRNLYDPTKLNPVTIAPKRWFRTIGGPTIATIAFIAGMPSRGDLPLHEYVYLVLPSATAYVTTVVLEVQFAHPWINDHIWKPFNRLGGRYVARLINIGLNFTVAMALYGSTQLGAHIPLLFDHAVTQGVVPLTQALLTAAIGAVTFHFALGQFQTDIAEEENRGLITSNQRYHLETTGALVVGGGRAVSYILPPELMWFNYVIQGAFFLLKTAPQFIKSSIAEKVQDRRLFSRIRPDKFKPSFSQKCVDALSNFSLINVPVLER